MHINVKQTSLLLLVAVMLGYLTYQICTVIGSDLSSDQSDGPLPMAQAAEPEKVSSRSGLGQATHSLGVEQKAYLKMVNQYELTRMKRRLLEEKAAIAAAQHRIDLLNMPTQQRPKNKANTDSISQHLRLSYADLQQDQWSATLNDSGRYYQVHIGSKLADSSVVTHIDRGAVVLRDRQGNAHRVTKNGIAIVPRAVSFTKPNVISQTDTRDEQRILTLPKSNYTIQLVASYHRDVVDNFVIANDLGNRVLQTYIINRGRPWYILLYGNYPTRVAAQSALRHLPPNLAKENPWICQLTNVQRDVRQRQRNKI